MKNLKGEIWVYSEEKETTYELLGEGRKLAREMNVTLSAITVEGGETERHFGFGADKVYILKGLGEFEAETYAEAISIIAKEREPEIILIGSTKRGKELAPRLAAKLETGCATDCVKIYLEGEKKELIVERWIYGGNALAKEKFTKKPSIITIPPKTFEKPIYKERKGEKVEVAVRVSEPRVKVIETKKREVGEERLEDASVIISGGAGVKRKEDFKILRELANMLRGQIGCSRPIAVDYKWFPEWIGLSGHKVKPNVYIACGISGKIQHIAGIRGSKIIVAINKDPEAEIFKVADYGIVGDLYEVVPALINAFKRRFQGKIES